ncbi:helix-turn-helix domain-containing protein [Mycolicibacterium sp.]|uniref:helix-turn-helix domain-containing protein n=1 Tax=Mycolicibacterium sp. TaxID=2320850 RepID=UPI0037CAF3DA
MTETTTHTADFVELSSEELVEALRAIDRSGTKLPDWIRELWAKDDRLLTAEEVAEKLRISLRTTLDLLRAGAIEGTRVGRQWRVRASALDAFLSKPRPAPRVVVTDAVNSKDILVIGPTGSGKGCIVKELRAAHPDRNIREIQIEAASA